MKTTHALPLALGILFLATMKAQAADPAKPEPFTKTLWPKAAAPGAEKKERLLPDRGDGVDRLTDITAPTLTVYPAVGQGPEPGPAVLVFPGGGYEILAINKEGTEIAAWLNRLGITAIVVKYRVPQNREGAFQDAQRAIRLVRHHAREWAIDPNAVGLIGFSAGGHLAARLSTDFAKRTYPDTDEADHQDARPDFCLLIYPAYLGSRTPGKVSEELPVASNTPPTFLVQTKDDRPYVAGTILYDEALKKAGVPSTFHLFDTGGHGYGLRPSTHPVAAWPGLCEPWLKAHARLRTPR